MGELMTVLEITVPLPPHELAPNARVYRMRKAAIIAEYRDHVTILTRNACAEQKWTPPARARISMHWAVLVPKRKRGQPTDGLYRPFDWDNAVAAFKAGQDGLVRGGALAGDGRDQLEGGAVTFDPKAGPYVRVRIEAIV